MNDEFDILAAKVLAGEASADQHRRLEELLTRHADLRKEFAELQLAADAIRALGSLADAMDAPPAPVPVERVRELEEAVRHKFRGRATAREKSEVASHLSAQEIGYARPTATNVFASVFGWLQTWLRAVHRGVALTAAAVVLVICAILLLKPSLPSRERAKPATSAVGYLLVQQGQAEVWQAGHPKSMNVVATLASSDELRLWEGTEALVITPKGIVALRGPRTMRATELAAAPLQTLAPPSPQQRSPKPTPFQVALFSSPSELREAGLLVSTRASQSIALYSPLGATASLTPLILWKGEPGKTFDIIITDEFDSKSPPWRLSGVASPLEFDQVEAWRGRSLANDGLYRLRIAEAGKPLTTGEYTFRTLKAASAQRPIAPADKLIHAYQLLATDASRTGDALADLLTLPPEISDSELALRAKLLAFGQAGYRDDFESVLAKLRRQ
jgi:hypothetical protein